MSQPEFTGETKVEKSGLRRICLMGLGWVCIFLGVIGIVLPLLPTTPFLLVALWAFSRSSIRFHNWLYTHKYLGPMVQDWNKFRVIPMKAKILAVTMMSASLALVTYKGILPLWGLILVGLSLSCVAFFIIKCPSLRPDKVPE
ncbi:YbaN family protein [Kiloniella antarctica]|uniref:YbaN family protein n=1 Tax=Kiloniella antarctica TaxID=1550907 RepID=A0ABW5BP98_9PROT